MTKMKVTVNQKELHNTLRVMAKVATMKATTKALTCVRLTGRDGKLTITATATDLNLTRTMGCDGDIDVCFFAGIGAALTKPTKPRQPDTVEISVEDESTVNISVEGMTTNLPAVPVEDFPDTVVDEESEHLSTLGTGKLIEALAYVAPVASRDATRPRTNCVALLSGGRVAATDGHRLHTFPVPMTADREVLIPLPAVKTLQTLLKEDLFLQMDVFPQLTNRLRVTVGDWRLETKLLETAFPPVDKVVPKSFDSRVTLEAAQMYRALTRMKGLVKSTGVKLTLNDTVRLESVDPDFGNATIIINHLENTHTGDDLHIGFTLQYMLDAIGKEGVISLELNGSMDPLVVRREQSVGVVMPRRI